MSSLKKKAIKGLAWQSLNVGAQAITNIVFLMIISRLLKPEVFGEFAIASVIISILIIFAEFGFGAALVQIKEINNLHISYAFIYSAILSILVFFLLFYSAQSISSFFDNKIRANVIQLSALILIISPFGLISNSLLVRKMNFEEIFKASYTAYIVGNVLTSIALAYLGYGIYALIFGILVSQVLLALLLYYYNPIKISLPQSNVERNEILKFGSGISAVRIINKLAEQTDKIILGKLISISQLGYFERAQKIQVLPLVFLSSSIDGVLFSFLAKLQDDLQKIRHFFFSILNLVLLFTLYISITIFSFADIIIELILGSQWSDSVPILQILSCLIFLQGISRIGDILVRALNKFVYSAAIKLIYLISTVFLIIAGYNSSGLHGGIAGLVIGNVIHTFGMILLSVKITNGSLSLIFKNALPIIFIATLFVLKNYILVSFQFNSLVRIFSYILTDGILIYIIYKFPFLIGKNNCSFVNTIINEPFIAKRLSKFGVKIKPRS